MTLHGTSPVTSRWPVTGVTGSAGPSGLAPPPAAPLAPREANRECEVHTALHAEVAREQEQQLLEVAVEGGVRCLLDAEVLEDRDATARRTQPVRHLAHLRLRHPGLHAGRGNVDLSQVVEKFIELVGMGDEPVVVEQVVVDQHSQERREQVGVTAGSGPQVDVGQFGRLAAPADRPR